MKHCCTSPWKKCSGQTYMRLADLDVVHPFCHTIRHHGTSLVVCTHEHFTAAHAHRQESAPQNECWDGQGGGGGKGCGAVYPTEELQARGGAGGIPAVAPNCVYLDRRYTFPDAYVGVGSGTATAGNGQQRKGTYQIVVMPSQRFSNSRT